jgi:hypothetical protein
LPSPPPLVDVKVVRVPIKALAVLVVLVVGVLVTINLVHNGNRSLASRQGTGSIVSETPGVVDLRSGLSQLADDLEPIATDGSAGKFDALAAECRKLRTDAEAAQGRVTAGIGADIRTHVQSALTVLTQGTQSCAAGDYAAAAQSFTQGLAELTQATIALNG